MRARLPWLLALLREKGRKPTETLESLSPGSVLFIDGYVRSVSLF